MPTRLDRVNPAHADPIIDSQAVPLFTAVGGDIWWLSGYVAEPLPDAAESTSAVVHVCDLIDDPFEYRVTIAFDLGDEIRDDLLSDEPFFVGSHKVAAVEVIGDCSKSLTAERIAGSRAGEAITWARRCWAAYHFGTAGGLAPTAAERRTIDKDAAWLFAERPPNIDAWRVARAWYRWHRDGCQGSVRAEIAKMIGKGDSDESRTWVKNRMAQASRLGMIPPATSTRSRRPPKPASATSGTKSGT